MGASLPKPSVPYLGHVGLLAAAYAVAGKLGLALATFHPSATVVWAPTGIALAALLVLGPRIWPGVLLGAFLVNVTTAGSVVTSAGIAVGNTLEGLAGTYLVNRFANGRRAFDRMRDVFTYAVFAGMGSTMISATVGVTSLSLGGYADWAEYGSIWLTWWLGDVGGVLIVAPVLILWSAPALRWKRDQTLEVALLLLALFLVSQVVFGGLLSLPVKRYPLQFLSIPILVWVAFRFGPRETAMAILLLSGMAIWGTLRGVGPFAGELAGESLLFLQAFMDILAVMALVLAAGVAERRRAEEQVRLVVEAAPTGMVLVNREGTILLVNAQIETLFGYGRDELLGQTVEVLVPERFRGQHPVHRQGFYEAPGPRAMGAGRDLYGLRKDGSEFPVEIGLNPIETAEGGQVMASIVDITERKRAEEQLKKAYDELEQRVQERTEALSRSNAELEQFAYAASHDLQEPLRMVASYTQLLAKRYKGRLDADADEFIAYAVDGATRMQELIRNLLAYARVGIQGEALRPTNCETVLALVMKNLQSVIKKTGATVTHDLLPTVMADGQQLGQVFQNLIGNALKFHGREPPCVHISARQQGGAWIFSVRDQGIGLDPKDADRIFIIFQRLHSRAEYPGTGIGLAICKKIVERHGGHLWVESQPGQGATFFFTIPQARETIP